MRNLLNLLVFIILAGALGYLAYYQIQEAETSSASSETAASTPQQPAASPAPSRPAQANKPVEVPETLPEEVVYLTKRKSVMTGSGIHGVEVGTRLKVLEDLGENLRVSDGEEIFQVTASNTTRNVDRIKALIERREARRRAIEQRNAELDRRKNLRDRLR